MQPSDKEVSWRPYKVVVKRFSGQKINGCGSTWARLEDNTVTAPGDHLFPSPRAFRERTIPVPW